jgi:hypothetical protein
VDDIFLKRDLRNAVVLWGDDASADALADRLARPDFPQWEEAMQALARLRPDARTADLAVSRLSKNASVITEVARLLGAQADRPLLAMARGDGELRTRIEACRLLGSAGTPAALPDLKALADHAGDESLAREAEASLKAIAARE